MNSPSLPGRRPMLALSGLIAVASSVVVLAAAGARESHATTHQAHAGSVPVLSARAVAFHDQMRVLWEAHGAWTHMVITSFVGNLPNLTAEETVLLQNQVAIGNAVKLTTTGGRPATR